MKNLFQAFSLLLCVCLSTAAWSQISIAAARAMAAGSTVTVQGVLTNGAELGIIRYMEDNTGGIAAYPGTGSQSGFTSLQRGDLVRVTGVLKLYNNLLEIDPITSYTLLSSGNPLPTPQVITPNGVGEETESELVTVQNAIFTAAGGTFAVGNFTFTANGQTSQIYLRSGHPLIGTQIPLANVDITGITSQFNSLYQLLPRDGNDIAIASSFYLTSNPVQSNITTTGFTLTWGTNAAGTTLLRYGTSPTALTNEITVPGNTLAHTVNLTGLQPATIYYIQAVSSNGGTTVTSNIEVMSTASQSSGEIQVHFNHGVDGDFAEGAYPMTTSPNAIENAIINRIDAATATIDVCMFNMNRPTIVPALTAAQNRGVRVRYVTDVNSFNEALQNPPPPFPVFGGNDAALMHNKFFIIDVAQTDKAWVLMGSMNQTDQNVGDDPNNMVFIQDQSLAKAFTLEFEEMWGGTGNQPGIFAAKFGASKTDNTPHRFNINGVAMELYFSPSDGTTNEMVKAIETADTDINFALLTFTMNSLGTAVKEAHDDGVAVRGIIENINDQGSEYEFLLDNGIDVKQHTPDGQMHHKYGIIDGANPASNPTVITGSHNWSNAAETVNDEHTLIIYNVAVANIFVQEFEARWCEVNGGTDCTTALEFVATIPNFEFQLAPNPAVQYANILFKTPHPTPVTVSIFTLEGKRLVSTLFPNVLGEEVRPLPIQGLTKGQYIITCKVGEQAVAATLIIQ